MSADGGISSYKTEKENNADLEELGLRFQYGCYMDKLAESCYSLGLWYDNFKHDDSKAMDSYRTACESHNHPEACLAYANGLVYGRGIKTDTIAAFNVFQRNCNKNKHERSCYAAGIMRAEGLGSHRVDYDEASQYFERGCDLEFSPACFHVGLLKMLTGTKDWPAIAKYWTKACDLGHFRACVNLGVMHKKGDYFEQNMEEYRRFIEKAEHSLKNNPPLVHGEFVNN